MSRIVRAALVVRIPRLTRTSGVSSVVERWVRTPGGRLSVRTVTSGVRGHRLKPQSAAAESWLSTAPSPHARTAAAARATGSTRG